MKKKWIRYAAIAAVTAVLFLAGLYLADRLVTPEGEAEQFYDEPKNSIDVLTVGGSQTMCTLWPVGIYDATGLTAYNLSTWSQPVWVSYYYIKEALKYQKPQVIVLDVFGAFYDRSYMTGVDIDLVSDDFAQLLKPSLNLLELNLARRRVQVTAKHWYEYLNIAKYHSRITELTADSFGKLFRDDSTAAKGYGPFFTTEDFTGYVPPATDTAAELYPYAREYLIKTMELCRKEGIRLVLVKMPHIADENDVALLNTIRALAEEYSVDFLDFCSTDALGLDPGRDFADHGHLNNFGAQKATAAMAEYLNGLGLSVRHTDAIAERWRLASIQENNENKKMEVKLASTLPALLELADRQGSSAVILVKQDGGALDEADLDAMRALLAGTPAAMSAGTLRQNDVFLYTNGTLLAGEDAVRWCAENGVTAVAGPPAQILHGGEDHCYGRDGWNVAVLDTAAGEIYQFLSFAKEHGYSSYTR